MCVKESRVHQVSRQRTTTLTAESKKEMHGEHSRSRSTEDHAHDTLSLFPCTTQIALTSLSFSPQSRRSAIKLFGESNSHGKRSRQCNGVGIRKAGRTGCGSRKRVQLSMIVVSGQKC